MWAKRSLDDFVEPLLAFLVSDGESLRQGAVRNELHNGKLGCGTQKGGDQQKAERAEDADVVDLHRQSNDHGKNQKKEKHERNDAGVGKPE
jgi:hypothetical protein